MVQAAIAFEETAAFAEDGLRGEGGQLLAAVRLKESTAGNPGSAQPVHALEQMAFGRKADND